MLERLKIIFLCIAGAIIYGEIHDQITVRICLEYFTEHHPQILGGTQNPTLLAISWGVIATWWVGFFLGLPLAVCATVGKLPKITARGLIQPVVVVLLILGTLAAVAGCVGHFMAVGGYRPPEDLGVSESYRVGFVTAWFTHNASYGFGGLLGIALCVWALRRRYVAAKGQRFTPAQTAGNRP